MTPKEKARDLINKFSLKVLDTHLGGSNARVIECALLAVNEILNSDPSRRYWDTYDDETPSAIIYWEEVKQELNKL
jgi:hypothetical protein